MWGFSGSLGMFDSGMELSRGGVSVCLAENDRKEEMKEEESSFAFAKKKVGFANEIPLLSLNF